MTGRASRDADNGGPSDAAAVEHAALLRVLIAKSFVTYDELSQATLEAAKLFRDISIDGRAKITWQTTDEQLVALAKEAQERITRWVKTGDDK